MKEGSRLEYRKLGTSDLNISTVGYGCWAMGHAFWGEDVVDEESVAAVKLAFSLGINFYDTAQAYGCGHSERVLAQGIADLPRDQVIIATKTGLQWDADENITRNSSPEYIASSLDDSLDRLRTDYIDLFQVHWPDPDVPIKDTAAGMKACLDSGKIKAAGVSNYSVEQMTEFMEVCPLHSLQPPYSMLTRAIEAEILPFCREHNIGVLAYSPMARGLLTGKYDENATFPESDARSNSPMFKGERLAKNVAAVRELAAMAETEGRTAAQLALAWVLAQPGLTCALAGAKRPDQIAETAAASGWTLTPEQLAQIDAIIEKHGAG